MPVGSEAADALAIAAEIKLETANADAMTVTRRMTRSFYSNPIAMLALAQWRCFGGNRCEVGNDALVRTKSIKEALQI
ncbi:hypothetical protein HYPDE_33558 [Hyphomicrobium denitrificans 1NES1]|uniref:Uncharacterized protein n=1 Tax=Hyphomicrobium denitrificans 1NES1 TaxID=670307 RepID=N0B4D0_9HYPH|nr:hypothetical protein HYPDE_33558 [Hyphomicrobium denitrificans 1NES1]